VQRPVSPTTMDLSRLHARHFSSSSRRRWLTGYFDLSHAILRGFGGDFNHREV
jgi:hypothetical protein